MIDQKPNKQTSPFEGFIPPTSNYFPMPNAWIDICAVIDNLAELKVIQYVLRHTWGYKEYDGTPKAITTDEFMHGRKRKAGQNRIDKGTGLSNRSVIDGLRRAVEHGYLICTVDDNDKARIVKAYTPNAALFIRKDSEASPGPENPPLSLEEEEKQRQKRIRAREASRIERHLKRARKADLLATLTVDEWIETLNHFEWKCAYCGGDFELLEHFVPLVHYGGTTRTNCVPACVPCNHVKLSWHPERIPSAVMEQSEVMRKNINRVRAYLEALGKKAGDE